MLAVDEADLDETVARRLAHRRRPEVLDDRQDVDARRGRRSRFFRRFDEQHRQLPLALELAKSRDSQPIMFRQSHAIPSPCPSHSATASRRRKGHLVASSRPKPAARAMEDGQNLDVIAKNSIRNDVWRPAYDELTGPGQPARPPEVRMIAQCVNGSDKSDCVRLAATGLSLCDKISNRLEIRECGARPTDPHPSPNISQPHAQRRRHWRSRLDQKRRFPPRSCRSARRSERHSPRSPWSRASCASARSSRQAGPARQRRFIEP